MFNAFVQIRQRLSDDNFFLFIFTTAKKAIQKKSESYATEEPSETLTVRPTPVPAIPFIPFPLPFTPAVQLRAIGVGVV